MDKPTKLLREIEEVDLTDFSHVLYVCATLIEDSLLLGGAIPGQDYKILDLYKLGTPLAKLILGTTNLEFDNERPEDSNPTS